MSTMTSSQPSSGTKKPHKAIVARGKKKLTRATASKPAAIVRFKDIDSPYGLTKKTAAGAAKKFGLSLDKFFHVAAIQFIRSQERNYEADFGEVTPEGLAVVRKLAGPLPELKEKPRYTLL